MKKNKSDLVSIVFAIILTVIVFTIAIIAIRESNKQITPLDENSPIVTQVVSKPTPTTVLNPNEPPIAYDEKAQATLIEKIVNRPPLTSNDTRAKAIILATLPKEKPSGVVYQSERIIIDYTSAANMFQVEILTTDIPAAKAEANVWFRARGMSQRGICDLPLMFYLNSEVMEKLRGTGYIFDPLANSC